MNASCEPPGEILDILAKLLKRLCLRHGNALKRVLVINIINNFVTNAHSMWFSVTFIAILTDINAIFLEILHDKQLRIINNINDIINEKIKIIDINDNRKSFASLLTWFDMVDHFDQILVLHFHITFLENRSMSTFLFLKSQWKGSKKVLFVLLKWFLALLMGLILYIFSSSYFLEFRALCLCDDFFLQINLCHVTFYINTSNYLQVKY